MSETPAPYSADARHKELLQGGGLDARAVALATLADEMASRATTSLHYHLAAFTAAYLMLTDADPRASALVHQRLADGTARFFFEPKPTLDPSVADQAREEIRGLAAEARLQLADARRRLGAEGRPATGSTAGLLLEAAEKLARAFELMHT